MQILVDLPRCRGESVRLSETAPAGIPRFHLSRYRPDVCHRRRLVSISLNSDELRALQSAIEQRLHNDITAD